VNPDGEEDPDDEEDQDDVFQDTDDSVEEKEQVSSFTNFTLQYRYIGKGANTGNFMSWQNLLYYILRSLQ
jgi:hypothetical protein